MFLAVVAAIITIPIFGAALIFSLVEEADWWEILAHKNLWVMAMFVSLIAGLRVQLAFEATTVVGAKGASPKAAPVIGELEIDRNRSKAAYAAQVILIATFVFLCYAMLRFGSGGFNILPIAYSAILIFYDTRPDLGRRIFPKLWQ